MNRSKSPILIFLLLAAFLSFAPAAFAAGNPAQKLGRGLVHVVASPFQLPKNVIETTGEAESVWLAPWKGMSEGLGKGVYQMSRQALSGFVDIFTFWTPGDRDWAPVFEPPGMFPEI